jgi:2-dehydropantoate 2-reductase
MRVGILGAGAIGGYLGVCLSAAGAEVTMVGREWLVQARSQLAAVPQSGRALLPRASLRVVTEADALADADICLVTVKSKDTDQAGAVLAGILDVETPVVSFQNGLDNARRLGAHLGSERVTAGVVTYNVFRDGPRFCKATIGDLFAGRLDGSRGEKLRRLASDFATVGERLQLRRDIDAIILGKLLMNLNNGVCAAAGVSIADSLRSRDARWVFARCLLEAMAVCKGAGLRPARVTVIPSTWIARLLSLPGSLVALLARSIGRIDPAARSSTLQDLDRGRTTEIDDLNGAIVALARVHAMTAPANETIVSIIHDLERAGARGELLPYVEPAELRRRVERAMSASASRRLESRLQAPGVGKRRAT